METPMQRRHPKLLAALCALVAASAPARAQGAGGVEEALAALRSAAHGDAQLLELLAAAPGGAAGVLRALEQRSLASDAACDDDPCAHLSRAERAAVLARLERLPALVLERRAGKQDAATCCAEAVVALEVLAGSGAAVMEDALALGEPHEDATAELFAPVERAFSAAARAALVRDPRAYASVNSQFTHTHVALRPSLLNALGVTPQSESLALLPMLLGRDPGLDLQVLTQLISVARNVHDPLDQGRLVRVRSYLSQPDALLRSQAAQALGRLHDYESVRELIDLLSDEQAGVRASAHWSLRTITAMTLDASPLAWLSWYQAQTRWWSAEAPELLARLDHAEPAELVTLLRELGAKRLFRHPLTAHLLPLLRDEDPEVVLMACSAIQNLRSGSAASALAGLFDHEEARVRHQSRRAWRQVTGRMPPDDHLSAH
jgi:HEAT repeat protein